LPVEEALINFTWDETNFLELVHLMLIPHSASLLLLKPILLELEDKEVLSLTLHFKTLGDCHEEFTFHICLSVSQHKVNLFGVPTMNQGGDERHPDGCPGCHR
jgi:hypothetical protein